MDAWWTAAVGRSLAIACALGVATGGCGESTSDDSGAGGASGSGGSNAAGAMTAGAGGAAAGTGGTTSAGTGGSAGTAGSSGATAGAAGSGAGSGGAGASGSGGSAGDACGGCATNQLCIFQAGGPGPARLLCANYFVCRAASQCDCLDDQGTCVPTPEDSELEGSCQCDNGLE